MFVINKMNQPYKIHRWDAVIFPRGMNPIPTPIIYFKPDAALLKFAEDNHNALLVDLNVPFSMYDNKKVIGFLYKSSEIPNCRPIFFEKTELYVIVLQDHWNGYPECLGDFKVLTNISAGL